MALAFVLSARPANAQSILTPPVVVDRTAVTLTYAPIIGGTSTFDAAVSYQFGPGPWDLLVSYVSPSAAGAATGFRVGGRYHVRPVSPTLDVYGTIQYFSPSAGNTHFELGGGFTTTVAPGLKLYFASTYNSATLAATNAYISTSLGVQYEINRQFALIAGLEGNTGQGYIGISFNFAR